MKIHLYYASLVENKRSAHFKSMGVFIVYSHFIVECSKTIPCTISCATADFVGWNGRKDRILSFS